MKFRKLVSNLLIVSILLSLFIFQNFSAEEEIVLTPPTFAVENQLYAQGISSTPSPNAWQRWNEYSGSINAQSGVKYFFLPKGSHEGYFGVYNSYSTDVTVNGVTIAPNTVEKISYSHGEKYKADCNGKSYTYIVYTSDSDASVYVNDITNAYEDAEGTVYNDFYTFLTANKENAVKGSDVSIASDGTVTDTTLKKIKGRGNTTWKTSEKKPFTLTFNSAVSIGGLESKKFSMLSNSKDGTLLRNKVMYDLADSVGLPYSADTRFIDFYVNGEYRGMFQISPKVEMGKSSLVSLKDTSDNGVTENFNFLVEIDIWNYQNDTHFTSLSGQEIVLNTPELEDYDKTDSVQKAQMDFIQSKYAEFENALYNGTIADLEKICNIESLAKTYLVNEFSKNCDGGLTSTYYTYNAEEDKFYAAPVWDFDSGLGNVDCVRAGSSLSTKDFKGWFTKNIKNNARSSGKVNTLGQAFRLSGETSDGKTYSDIVTEAWKERFVPSIKRLLGVSTEYAGRLRSIDEYRESVEKASYNNYVMWDFSWAPQSDSYPNTYDGQMSYLKDWTTERYNWINNYLNPTEEPVTTNPAPPVANGYYLAGTGFGGWDSCDYPMTTVNGSKAQITYTFQKGVHYNFKVVKYQNGVITDYYQQDGSDSTTGKYITMTGTHNNSDITPTADTALVLTFYINEGVFRVEPYVQPTTTEPIKVLIGDVDGNGLIDIRDATYIQKYVAGIDLPTFTAEAADCNKDGEISVSDSVLLQKVLVKKASLP